MAYSYSGHWIFNVETKSSIGHVERDGAAWIVTDSNDRRVGVVDNLEAAGPLIGAHYDEHARWVREGHNYIKWTKFGSLEVFPLDGGWAVWLNGERHLLRHDGIAIFATAKEAQKSSEAHAAEGIMPSIRSADNLSWELFAYRHERAFEASSVSNG
jgi:hypothetical protein